MDAKHLAFRAGLAALRASGAARLLRSFAQGRGAILMFHHVRPYARKAPDPHRGLEITPDYLDAVLTHCKARGFDIVTIDEAMARLDRPGSRPFVALTFDDGYRDNLEHALPILRRHAAPFTLYVTTGFADGTAPLWWLDLADAAPQDFASRYAALRSHPDLRARIAEMAAKAEIDSATRTRALCLGWDAIADLARDPLCTIGAHTLTHPILGALPEDEARAEIVRSKTIIEERLCREVRHFAYPVGDRAAAGAREFRLAREAGFATAVTTRPGMLFPEHARHPHALPRLSVNGWHQTVPAIDTLLSGAPFWLLNRGRRLDID
jgi:peptidoglycan/xylan/chitin deacetylase (PgdA/CDA1 family)